jgi:hypothetical protein
LFFLRLESQGFRFSALLKFQVDAKCHLCDDQLYQIYTRLPFYSSNDGKEQVRLRREVVRLKREMNAVSAQDEFSKWAKLRRQHDKALEEHDKKGTSPG